MADENIVTNIVANADFSNLIADVNKVTSSLSKLQAQLLATDSKLSSQVASINRSFAENLRRTGQFSTHFVTLASDAESFGRKLDGGKLKLRDYFRTFQDHTKTSGGLIRDLAKQQVALQNAILQPLGKNAEGLMQFNVHVPRGLDAVKNKSALARQELQIFNKVIQDGGVQLINWGKNTQWAGRQLTVGLTVPLAAFGAAASKAFREADAELTRLTKVYGDIAGSSAQELSRVRKEVIATSKELSSAMGVNFNETIALAADIAATGKTGNDLLGSIQETTRLAVLGEVDRQEAMKATLAIQTTFKQNTDELSESINFLNAVENQTSTTLSDLVEAIPKAGPVIEGLGGSVKDLALYLTAMREGGVNATEGANALKSSLASLINPTKVAKDLFAGFGIDLSGIVTRNAGNLTQTLLELQSSLDKLDPLQKQQALEQLFGKFQFARLNALFSNLGKQGSQTLQVLDLMKASSKDLEKVATRELGMVTESASGKYKRALESLKADLALVGEEFLKIQTFFINLVDGVLKFVDKLPGPIKQILTFLGGLTAVAGPLIMLTGVLANFFGYIIKGVSHFKALFRGGEGWRMLTPEILAAERAGSLIEKTFYSDAEAATVLKTAIAGLVAEFTILQQKAATGSISLAPSFAAMTGSTGGRQVNPAHPLLSATDTRSMSHMNPVAGMTAEQRAQQTLFGVVPGAPKVNQKISNNPQIYMQQDLPNIPGLTSVSGVSTGVVAEEAAKWHAMTGALAMQSEREIGVLKKEVASTGLITSELSDSYQALLPKMTQLTSNAATASAAIVAELQASKITVDQARARILTLNAEVEALMGKAATEVAMSQGRTVNLTQVPLLNQPIVDPSGKSNMKELVRPGRTRNLLSKIAGALKVKTYGAPYSMETTIPKRFNSGNLVPGTGNTDTVPAMLTPGEFVINKAATQRNLPLLQAINGGQASSLGMAEGGSPEQLQSAHLMRADELVRDPLIQNALTQAGINPKNITSLTFQGYGQGTTAALPKQINNAMGNFWSKNPLEANRLAKKHGLPAHLIGDVVPLNNSDAKRLVKFYKEANLPQVSDFFGKPKYQQDLIRRIALSSAKARGTSTTTDYRLLFDEELKKAEKAFSRGGTHQAISAGLINEFIIDPKTGMFRDDALTKAYGTTGGANPERIRIRDNKSVGYRVNRGGAEYSARSASRMGGGRWSKMLPIVNAVLSRGRVKLNKGGQVPGVQYRAMGGEILRGAGSMGLGYAGSSMGGKLGQQLGGNTGAQIGQVAGSMISILPYMKMFSQAADQGTTSVTRMGKAMRWISVLPPQAKLAAVAVVAIGAAFYKVYDSAKKARQASEDSLDINQIQADQLGITYTNMSSKIKAATEAALKQKQLLSAKAATSAQIGGGLSITIKELKELQRSAKETQPALVEMFNAMDRSDVVENAANLKSQMVAAGKSASEAAKAIYAIVSVSNKADLSIKAISSKEFMDIVDKTTAAKHSITEFAQATKTGADTDKKEMAASFEAGVEAIDSYFNSISKVKDANGKIIVDNKAMAKVIEEMSSTEAGRQKIGDNQLRALLQQKPEYANILNSSDSIVDAWAKIKLYTDGVQADLINISGADAQKLLQIMESIKNAAVEMTTDIDMKNNPLHQLAVFGAEAKKASDLAAAASKRAAALAKTNGEAEVKIIDAKIKKINEEYDARVKALNAQKDQESYSRNLQSAQLEYQSAVASGDMNAAAQAQIKAEGLVSEYEQQQALQKLQDEKEAKLLRLEKQKEQVANKVAAAQKAAAAASERAAKAAEKLSKIQLLQQSISATLAQAAGTQDQAQLEKLSKVLKSDVTALQAMGEEGSRAASGMIPDITSKPGVKGIPTYSMDWVSKLKDLATVTMDAGAKKAYSDFGIAVDSFKMYVEKLLNLPDVSSGKQFAKGFGSGAPALLKADKASGGYVDSSGTKYTRAEAAQIPVGLEKTSSLSPFTHPLYGGKKNVGGIRGLKDYTSPEGYLFNTMGQVLKNKKLVGMWFNSTYGNPNYQVSYSDGGGVFGPGSTTSDSIPAMLSNGEYVFSALAVKNMGLGNVESLHEALRRGPISGRSMGGVMMDPKYTIPKMSTGGRVNFDKGGSARSISNDTITINNSIVAAPGMNIDQLADAIAKKTAQGIAMAGRSKQVGAQ